MAFNEVHVSKKLVLRKFNNMAIKNVTIESCRKYLEACIHILFNTQLALKLLNKNWVF